MFVFQFISISICFRGKTIRVNVIISVLSNHYLRHGIVVAKCSLRHGQLASIALLLRYRDLARALPRRNNNIIMVTKSMLLPAHADWKIPP